MVIYYVDNYSNHVDQCSINLRHIFEIFFIKALLPTQNSSNRSCESRREIYKVTLIVISLRVLSLVMPCHHNHMFPNPLLSYSES